MSGKSRRSSLDMSRCHQLFMFLYVVLIALGVCTAQQSVLGLSESLLALNSLEEDYTVVSDILCLSGC